jgi:hypothetical protein
MAACSALCFLGLTPKARLNVALTNGSFVASLSELHRSVSFPKKGDVDFPPRGPVASELKIDKGLRLAGSHFEHDDHQNDGEPRAIRERGLQLLFDEFLGRRTD